MTKIVKKTKKNIAAEVTKTENKETVSPQLSKVTKIHLAVVLVVIVLLSAAYAKLGIAATVNGKPVSRIEYLTRLQKQDNKTILDQMIQEVLINSEAAKKNVKIDQKDLDTELAKIEEQIKAQGMTLDEALKSEGVTKEYVFDQIRMQKIAEKLASPAAEASEAAIQKFLTDNKAYLPTGKSQEELKTLAKQQIEKQEKNAAIDAWLENLKTQAKIIYR